MKKFIRLVLIKCFPKWILRHWLLRNSGAMLNAVSTLQIQKGELININNKSMALLHLEKGLSVVGDLPTDTEKIAFGKLANKFSLGDEFSRVLIDVVTRYVYAHMLSGNLTIPYSLKELKYFHPQHKNLALQTKFLTDHDGDTVSEIFQIEEGWKVLDVGAYMGIGAMRIGEIVGESGCVLCVEGHPQNVAIINEHLVRNKCENISVLHRAIWNESGKNINFGINLRQANGIDGEVVEGSQAISVETINVPDLVVRLGCAPDLLSLTVNGAEVEAVEGLRNMKKELRPMRILAPGWYLKNGKPRWNFLQKTLLELNYKVAVTEGGLVYAWIEID